MRKELSLEDFTKAVKTVLGANSPKQSMYENRKPTKKELNTKWQLTRR